MPNIGPMELVLVLVIGLIVLGPKKLPDVGRSVGKGMREFKQAIGGEDAGAGDRLLSEVERTHAQPTSTGNPS